LPREPAAAPLEQAEQRKQQQRLDKLITRRYHTPQGIDRWLGDDLRARRAELTQSAFALGRSSHFDTRLSKDGHTVLRHLHTTSAAEFTDDRQRISEGIGDHLGKRSAPTTDERGALQASSGTAAGAGRCEEQAKLPILNPIEMGAGTRSAAARIGSAVNTDRIPGTVPTDPYGRARTMTISAVPRRASTRTLIFSNAPFDTASPRATPGARPPRSAAYALFNGKARLRQSLH